MRKIDKILMSLLALGTISSSMVITPNTVSAHRISKYSRQPSIMNHITSSRILRKRIIARNKRIIKHNKKAIHYLSEAYDISQYQGYLSNKAVRHLKNEIHFMILRAQGGAHKDTEFSHNAYLLSKYDIPYGAYSYSYYTSVASAKREAKNLYNRAPHARFYINDLEENDVGRLSRLNAATKAWASELHKLTRKPIVLYSGLYFMNEHVTRRTRNYYNAIWLADYSVQPRTSYRYDLWQKSSTFYSPALRERIDKDVFPARSHKPLSFWTGGKVATSPKHKAKIIKLNQAKGHKSKTRIRAKAKVGKIGSLSSSKNLSFKALDNNYTKAIDGIKDIENQEQNNPNASAQTKETWLKDCNRYLAIANDINRTVTKKQNTAHKAVHKHKVIRKHKSHRISNAWLKRYYSSHRIHTLKAKVFRISIYKYPQESHHRFVKRGTEIHHVHFYKTVYHGHWIRRAVGRYKGQKVDFTCRKGFVKPIY